MAYFKSVFLVFIVVCSKGIFSSETVLEEKILSYIHERFSPCGILEKTPNGFVYVKVDDAYIHELNNLIKDEGFEEPPYFDENQGLIGAYISVIYQEEMKKIRTSKIKECGKTVCFELEKCLRVHPLTWAEIEEVFVVVVNVPVLDELRKKYGFAEKKYPFHITIGVKRKSIANKE